MVSYRFDSNTQSTAAMQPFTQFARDDFGASHAKTPLLPETDCAGGYGSAGSSSPSSSDAEQISSSVDALLHLDHPAYDKLLPPQEPGVLGTLKRWRDLVGLPLMAVYFLLSFTQELPVTAIAQLLVNDLNISPAAMQLFYAYTYLPWSIKPAFALISDYIPLFGFRRRPYVVACCLCAAVAYAFVSWSAHSDSSMLGLCVLASMMMCFAEVVADSVAVEIGNRFSHAPLLREPAIREATSTVLTAGASSVSADVAQQDLVPESPDAQPIAPLRQTMSLVDVESQSALNSGDPSSVSQPENAIVVGLDESCDLPPSAPADLETETLKLLACVKRETRASITARPGCTLDITAPASVQSAAMSVRTLGSIFASGLATALATFASPRQIILGAACIPLVAAIPALFLPDKPVSPLYFRTAMGAVCSLRGIVSQRSSGFSSLR